MSWRKLGLYVVVLLIMALFYHHQKTKLAKITAEKEAAKKIFQLKKEDVRLINLKNEYGSFSLLRKEGKWWLQKPVADWASQTAIDSLLDTLIDAKADKKITPLPSDLTPFGLKRPKIEVNLKTDKKSLTLKLGSNTPNEMHVYALTNDQKAIYLLNTSIVWSLNKNLDDLRDKHLLILDPARVVKLVIKQGEKTIELVKEKNKWQVKQPFVAKGDKDEIEDLLFTLQTERITTFKEAKIKPQLEVDIWQTNDKSPRWLKLELEKDKLLGKSNYHPGSFTLAKELWQRLTRPAAYYKDRHFIHFNKDEVAKIEIRYKDKHLVAKRQGKNWTIKPEGMAETYELDFLLDDLSDLKYLPEKKTPPPFTSALAEVKLWDKHNHFILDLLYFKEKEETWIKKDKKYYLVKETVWDSFPEKLKEEQDGESHH